jgi:hypothetical protein
LHIQSKMKEGSFSLTLENPKSISVILKYDLLLVFQKNDVFCLHIQSKMKEGSFSLTLEDPPSKSVILKYDLLFVFQKQRFCLYTQSQCQSDNEVPTVKKKTVILNVTWFLYSKTVVYMTPTVKVTTVTLRLQLGKYQCSRNTFFQAENAKPGRTISGERFQAGKISNQISLQELWGEWT